MSFASPRPDVRLRRLARYGIVGFATLGIYLALGAWLKADGAAPALLASLPFAAAVAVNYLLQRSWVFEDARPVSSSVGRYLAMLAAGWTINAIAILHSPFESLLWTQLYAATLVVCSNAVFSFSWVFKDARSGAASTQAAAPFARLPHLSAMRRDAGLYAFIALYAGVALALSLAAGVPWKFSPLTYVWYSYSIPIALYALVIGVGTWAICSGRPFEALRRARSRWLDPRTVAGVLLFLALCVHMGVFTSVKTLLTDLQPFHADVPLADLDDWLHRLPPWTVTTALLPASATAWICQAYFAGWGVLLPVCLLACIFSPRLRAVRDQYLWTHVIVWPLLGNAVALAGMSAGPVFYGPVTGDFTRFAGLMDYLAQYPPLVEGHAYLWNTYVSRQVTPAGGISAFPSMHVATATMFVLLAGRIDRWLMAAAAVFCGFILFSSVQLGWHYAVDGYFSIIATVAVWRAVGWALRRRASPASRAAHARLPSARPTSTQASTVAAIEQ